MWSGWRVEGPTFPPAALSEQHARTLLLPWWPLYRPLPRAALSCSGSPFCSTPCSPQPLYLASLAARLKAPLGFPPSFGQWYRGETEAPGTETSSVAPSQLQGGEETPQPPHLEPVGSPTAPNS